MVSFERQGSTPEMIVKVFDHNLAVVVPEVNLTRRYGMSGIYCRVESDGLRFAATSRIGNSLRVLTLAMLQNDLVLHEPLQTAVSNGYSPHLASKRSGGGGNTEYAIVYVSPSYTPPRIGVTVYEGRAGGRDFDWRSTDCDGLWVSATGRPAIGETLQFGLDNVGADRAGLLLGQPAPAVLFCASCSIGLDPTGFIVPFPVPMSLTLPREPALVGLALSVQGFSIGSGSCAPARLRLSNTVDFRIQ